jgi:site-specific DNA-methyltransferase (adenine-specific)
MKRRPKVNLETPPSSAPNNWHDIDAQHWQSHGGKWAAPQHYMCTYMAMFPPELPHYFIQRFTKAGDTVLDPFSGRGTTAVEASAQGRVGIGNDLNPLAVALSRGKISNPKLDEVISRLEDLKSNYNSDKWSPDDEPDKIKMIYHPNTLSQLCYLKDRLDWSKQGVDAFLVSVIMGAMHGQSSGFLSVSMPNTFSMGWNYVKKYIREKNLECPDRDVFEVVEKRVRRYLKKGYLVGSGKIIEGDVRNLNNKIDHDSIQLLFTSPPYLKVIKYGLYNWIRLWFLTESGSHEEVDEKLDDTHALIDYLDFIKDSLTSTLPLLDRKRGVSCWAIGDVKDLNLAWTVWYHVGKNIEIELENGEKLRYKLIAILDDKIPENQKVTKIWKTKKWVINRVEEGISEVLFEFDSAKEAESSFKIISECQEIGRTIQRNYPESIDGREAIKWMRSVDSSHWRKMEWPGHYLEEFGGQMLDEEYGEATIPKYGNTEFDRLIKNIIIDFKIIIYIIPKVRIIVPL